MFTKIKNIFLSNEGKIFFIGFCLSIFLFLYVCYYWIIDIEKYKAVLSIIASDLFLGRMVGISVGLNMNLDTTTIIFLNFLVETITVFLFYSVFLLSWNKLFTFKRLHTSMEKIKDIATKYQQQINKYGMFGLFAFVLFPFFMTGATIGSIVGFLMGFSHKKTITIVTLSTFVAIFLWTYFIKKIQAFLNSLNENGFIYFITFLVFVVLIGLLYKKLSKGKEPLE